MRPLISWAYRTNNRSNRAILVRCGPGLDVRSKTLQHGCEMDVSEVDGLCRRDPPDDKANADPDHGQYCGCNHDVGNNDYEEEGGEDHT